MKGLLRAALSLLWLTAACTTTEAGQTTSLSTVDAVPSTVEQSDDSRPEPSCDTTPEYSGVYVSWQGLPGGATVTIWADDEALFDYGDGEGAAGFTAFGREQERAYTIDVSADGERFRLSCGVAGPRTVIDPVECSVVIESGVPEVRLEPTPLQVDVFRDGEPLPALELGSSGLADLSASPGDTHAYSLVLSRPSGNIEPVEVFCGEATVPLTQSVTDRVSHAKERFARSSVGAYAYLTLSSLGGEPMALVMIYDGQGPLRFEPPSSALVGPFLAHDVVLAALEEDRDVEVDLDPTTGAVIRWSIDGEGEVLHCFTTDTAPPELRSSLECDPKHNILGPSE